MIHIIKIQSILRAYLGRKRYVVIYEAILRIQNFILDRIDRKNLLINIKYLASFVRSKNKVNFLQDTTRETITHKVNRAVTKVENTHKEDVSLFKHKINNLTKVILNKDTTIEILEEKNKNLTDTIKLLEQKNNNLSEHIESISKEITDFTQKYNKSSSTNHSLKDINKSLENINVDLCSKIGDIYLDLAKTTEDLQRHKNKSVWDVLFNRIK